MLEKLPGNLTGAPPRLRWVLILFDTDPSASALGQEIHSPYRAQQRRSKPVKAEEKSGVSASEPPHSFQDFSEWFSLAQKRLPASGHSLTTNTMADAPKTAIPETLSF